MSHPRSDILPLQVPGLLTIVNAVENASGEPITPADILAVLKGEGGPSSQVRAIFSDVSLRALEQTGAASGVDMATILAAYRVARDTVAAANPELDRILLEPW